MSCGCPKNYKLEGKECYRIDPCLISNGGCSHNCFSDDSGNVKCSCPENYTLSNDTSCILEDLCQKNNGGCSHKCDFSTQNVVCSCSDNFVLEGDGKTCRKVVWIFSTNFHNNEIFLQKDPCQIENGGCTHYCENLLGIPKCSCPPKYVLEPNGRTCILGKVSVL